MKYEGCCKENFEKTSRPARGGWIEIHATPMHPKGQKRPAPHGAGGLKLLLACVGIPLCGLVPPRTGRVD